MSSRTPRLFTYSTEEPVISINKKCNYIDFSAEVDTHETLEE